MDSEVDPSQADSDAVIVVNIDNGLSGFEDDNLTQVTSTFGKNSKLLYL